MDQGVDSRPSLDLIMTMTTTHSGSSKRVIRIMMSDAGLESESSAVT